MLVASAMRRTASSLNSVLNFLAFFFPIGLSHYGRNVTYFLAADVSHFWGPLQSGTKSGTKKAPPTVPFCEHEAAHLADYRIGLGRYFGATRRL
jgi:hypothetical protein